MQDLAKLHHSLDDMAKIRPPDLMLEGFEWRARPLDKVFDADTRAVLKRCILVEVTAQCVKDSVREKRKFGSDKAISMAESLSGVSTGSVVCGDVTSSGTVSAPQLFASNTLTVTNTSDFSDDLFLTKNWAGWSKLQVSNNSAAPDSGPELRLLGNQSARVFLERDGGAHQCELIMINDEALVQTKSLSTQLSLTTNQRNPGCLVIAGNTGNVVCNTSFTDLSDSRVKTEIAEADVAELLQLFDSVEAKQYKRPDMNGDLRLGFASDDFAGTKWKNLTGTTRWSDGTEMVTLDYSHLTSVLWGVCKGFQARLDALEAWQASRHPGEPCSSPFLGVSSGLLTSAEP